MPAQMEEAAVNAIATAGNMSQEEAQAMVTEWKVSIRVCPWHPPPRGARLTEGCFACADYRPVQRGGVVIPLN